VVVVGADFVVVGSSCCSPHLVHHDEAVHIGASEGLSQTVADLGRRIRAYLALLVVSITGKISRDGGLTRSRLLLRVYRLSVLHTRAHTINGLTLLRALGHHHGSAPARAGVAI
jgi:hypothetical protein